MRLVGHSRFLSALGMTGGCSEYFMKVVPLTTWNEKGGSRTKGGFETRPYDRLMGSIFVSMRGCDMRCSRVAKDGSSTFQDMDSRVRGNDGRYASVLLRGKDIGQVNLDG